MKEFLTHIVYGACVVINYFPSSDYADVRVDAQFNETTGLWTGGEIVGVRLSETDFYGGLIEEDDEYQDITF